MRSQVQLGNEGNGPDNLLKFRRRSATQQAVHAEVFIYRRPINAITAAARFPIAPLLRGGLEQPGKPKQGNADRPTVEQGHDQGLDKVSEYANC